MAVRRARGARRPHCSQHFLRSSALAAELVALAHVGREDLVLEVGAGDGVITAALSQRAGYVVALEIDPALVRRLRRRFGPGSGVLVVEGDAFGQAVPRLPFRVVSNVPFDATTRLLRALLDDPHSRLECAALIVQWEVACKRARRTPSTLLGVSWAPWWELTLVRQLPGAAFRPQPSVDAGIVVMTKRPDPLLPPSDVASFRSLLRKGFTHGPRALASARELKRLGLPRSPRASELGAEAWIALFRAAGRRRSRGRSG